ncbi:MAG TPA: hypothetical protein DD719_00510 [Desulfotomaculum sp.]|nr:hypothetical protein [Desulfotomaculum sp.]HCJ79729.1 hypothetical protein [Desulfotomaculum sp.]
MASSVKRTLFFLLAVVSLIFLPAGLALAEDVKPPIPYPAIYQGSVKTTTGGPVAGGVIQAYVGEELVGEVPFARGYYGDPEDTAVPKLIAYSQTGQDLTDKNLVFKVVIANKIYPASSLPAVVSWKSGELNTVDLIVDLATGKEISPSAKPTPPVYPIATPKAGHYSQGITVTLTSLTPGAKIYYTTDGTDPKNSAGRQEYTAPLPVTQTATIKAVAVKDNLTSEVSIFNYTFGPLPGETSPDGGVSAVIFKDLSGHWAKDTVEKMVYQDIIKGYEDDTFRPENEISRLEAAAILVRALGLTGGTEAELAAFSDAATVPAWGKQILATAVKEALIKGYPAEGGKTALNPANPITRAELATLLSRLIIKKQGAQESPAPAFADQDQIPAWAQDGIALAAAKDIIKGYPDNTFKPAKKVTRAETAVMVQRLMEALK